LQQVQIGGKVRSDKKIEKPRPGQQTGNSDDDKKKVKDGNMERDATTLQVFPCTK
jgi:hypothetical protein